MLRRANNIPVVPEQVYAHSSHCAHMSDTDSICPVGPMERVH